MQDWSIKRFLNACGDGQVRVESSYSRLRDFQVQHSCDPRWKLGARVALDALHGADLLSAVLTVWGAGCVPVMGASAPDFVHWPGAAPLWLWSGGLMSDAERPAEPGTVAFVHRTSGSSGLPKFAGRSIDSLAWEAEGYRACYDIRPGDRAYFAAPIEHSFAFGALFGFLLAGARVELEPVFNPRSLARRLVQGQVDYVVLTPTMARLACLAAQSPPSPVPAPLRCVIAGAGPVPETLNAEFVARFGVSLGRNYGSSETGGTVGMLDYGGERVVGRPFANVDVVSPAETEQASPEPVSAELVLNLPATPVGYEGDMRTVNAGRHVWNTGDRAHFDSSGNIVLDGRLDDLVKVNGRLVDLAHVASTARAVDGVVDAVALSVQRKGWAETADVVVVCETAGLPRNGLDADIAGQLAACHAATRVATRLIDALPRTAAGKIDKVWLRRWLSEGGTPR